MLLSFKALTQAAIETNSIAISLGLGFLASQGIRHTVGRILHRLLPNDALSVRGRKLPAGLDQLAPHSRQDGPRTERPNK